MAFQSVDPSTDPSLILTKEDYHYPCFDKISKDYPEWGKRGQFSWGRGELYWIKDEERNIVAVNIGCILPQQMLSRHPWWTLVLIRYQQQSFKVLYVNKLQKNSDGSFWRLLTVDIEKSILPAAFFNDTDYQQALLALIEEALIAFYAVAFRTTRDRPSTVIFQNFEKLIPSIPADQGGCGAFFVVWTALSAFHTSENKHREQMIQDLMNTVLKGQRLKMVHINPATKQVEEILI